MTRYKEQNIEVTRVIQTNTQNLVKNENEFITFSDNHHWDITLLKEMTVNFAYSKPHFIENCTTVNESVNDFHEYNFFLKG